MLEKIGLPAKPSLRGNNWVVDASHCQGCSNQFTFINRKHHCRRCGGIFCNSCAQQRMVLRGQGDSPVRICEPCKKLEEAARFELRYGHKTRAGRGSSRSMSKQDDEILSKVLGNERESFSSGLTSNNDTVSSVQRSSSSASSSNPQEVASQDEAEALGNPSVDVSSTPEELRQQASEEKNKYKILKGQGKSADALKAFKRGKELERQADALELYIRKNRRKASLPGKLSAAQNKDSSKQSVRPNKVEKNDLASELRELGWSDMDLREDDKKPASMSLEGELVSLLGEVSQNTSKTKGSIDTTQVLAHKKKALMLKREGKLAEAKEELKKAKLLEKQIEEQAILAEAEDSDDELSALSRSMDSDKQDDLSVGYGQKDQLDFNHLLGVGDDLGIDNNFEVTDRDMEDPEIAAALESLGWNEDNHRLENVSQPVSVDREGMLSEILSLKKEALKKKRAGNAAEAMEHLKKAKALERDLESYDSQENKASFAPKTPLMSVNDDDGNVDVVKTLNSKVAPKSRLVIQKELLGLKKKALALRREGKLDEAEEELKKGKALELQLEEIDNAPKEKAKQVSVNTRDPDLSFKHVDTSSNVPLGDGEDDVTEQDMEDPLYLSLLSNLGWKEEDSDRVNFPPQPSKQNNQAQPSKRRSKSEMQRELLSLKRTALALRRQGKSEEAEEALSKAKAIEARIEEMEAPKIEVQVYAEPPVKTAFEEEDKVDVTEEDMHDPALLSVLDNLGWKDEEHKPLTMQSEPSEQTSYGALGSTNPSTAVPVEPRRSKGEIQRELLGLKRKALAHRRKGETEEAEEVLRMSKALEAQIEEMETPEKVLRLVDKSSNDKPVSIGSSIIVEKHSILKDVVNARASDPPLQKLDGLMPLTFQVIEKGNPLMDHPDDMKAPESTGSSYPSGGSMPVTDLLSGEDWRNAAPSADNLQDKQNSVHYGSPLTSTPIQLGSNDGWVSEDKVSVKRIEEKVHADEKPQINEVKPVQGISSPNNQSPLRHEILTRKRKAVALKREGKLAEAMEELRQAKLLEKKLDEDNSTSVSNPNDASASTSAVTSFAQKEQVPANSPPKPLSGRDRFKLQQESLSHKRQAMKLRREGRMEEAEAEFELAKALENQLEQSQDPTKSSAPVDDVAVEDLLDPELLSALKAIGMGDTNAVSERHEPATFNAATVETSNQERTQLEKQIKAEKVKALNLKRSGKQAEALDALRRSKQLEKKLNALV